MRVVVSLVLLTLTVFVLATLYLTGPKVECVEDNPVYGCQEYKRNSAWGRISSAITGN